MPLRPKYGVATGHSSVVQLVAGSRNSGRKHVTTLLVSPVHGRLTLLSATVVKLLMHADSPEEQGSEAESEPPSAERSYVVGV